MRSHMEKSKMKSFTPTAAFGIMKRNFETCEDETMRMRKKKNLEPRMEACKAFWIQDPHSHRGHWRELMPEAKELRVEVGCGKGKFTVETAAAEPDILLIAVERVREAMVVAMEKAKEMGLSNVYFIDMDAAEINSFFADDEIDLLYSNFC